MGVTQRLIVSLVTVAAIVQLAAATSAAASAESTLFIIHNNKELRGCTENQTVLSDMKWEISCAQACISSGWQCQSFNFFRHSQTCELKACNTLKAGTLFTLSNNSLSSYYEVKESTFPGCKTSHGIDTCKSAATLSCTPGSDVYGRTCLCHDWASGDDCSERTDICTPEGICYEMTSAANLASANSHCNSISGNLLTIDYPLSLQDPLRSYLTFLTNQDILIGIEYNSVYQDFAYTGNKQPLTGYTNWLEEKNATERRGCVKLSYVDDYKWVDVDCSTELPSICVVPTCQASFTKYNGSCYYINGSLRSWDEQLNFCNFLAEDSRVALPKFKEEDDMLINLFSLNFDNSYPVTLGLSDYTNSQTFSSVVTDWIVLDMHMKWSHLGCYDNSLVEMSSLEGNSNILSADIATRADAVDMCFYASRMHNHKVFGVSEGGACSSSGDTQTDYSQIPSTTGCVDGKGSSGKMDLYEVPNNNLYYNFAFDQPNNWNGNERTFFWWAGDSYRWHDDGRFNTRTACKVEFCPQGFISYQNKCFKVIIKLQPRGNARDECQSYTGADLWNPEYSDESEFLSNHLSYLKKRSAFFWTGIVNTNVPTYEVMGKSVGDNYNVYPVGAEPVSRRYHDTRSQLTHVQMNSEIPGAGKLVAWEFYSNSDGVGLDLFVLRSETESCKFQVIGINTVTVTSGFNRVDIEEVEQISVEAGDYIGIRSSSGSSVRFNADITQQNQCFGNSALSLTVGGSVDFGGTSTIHRVYSYRALFQPSVATQEQVFDTPHSAGNCYLADYGQELAVREADCGTQAHSICEIKRVNRVHP